MLMIQLHPSKILKEAREFERWLIETEGWGYCLWLN
jgi:hypothetical protein